MDYCQEIKILGLKNQPAPFSMLNCIVTTWSAGCIVYIADTAKNH
jgi:hypothetical protein